MKFSKRKSKRRNRPRRRERFSGLILPLLLLCAAAAILVAGCGGEGSDRPNIILLTIDTLRSDRLGYAGYEKAVTPALDSLAASGAVFERCYSVSPTTLASHTAILTGRYPRSLNVSRNGSVVPSSALTMSEILREEGYTTIAFVSSYALDPEFGLLQGFDRYDACRTEVEDENTQDYRRGADTVASALDWLENRDGAREPFFFWLHLFDPHSPYDPPPPLDELFDPGYSGTFTGSMDDLISIWLEEKTPGESDLNHIRALYDAEVAYTDQVLSKFFHAVRERSLEEKSLVIVVADHGESLEPRGEIFNHGKHLYDSVIKVPLVLSGEFSDKFKIPENISIPYTVRTIDILPTVLDILGMERRTGLSGESFYSLLNREQAKERIVFAEATKPYSAETPGCGDLNENKSKMALQGRWKYIRTPYTGAEELYNLVEDPGELKNLLETGDALTTTIADSLSELLEGWRVSSAGVGEPEGEGPDPEVEERLRSLGYIDD